MAHINLKEEVDIALTSATEKCTSLVES